jgi:hypothetical protein
VALVVIPYFNVNIEGKPFWSGSSALRLSVTVGVVAALLVILGIYEAWTVLVPTVVVGGALLGTKFLQSGQGRMRGFLYSRPLSWWVMTWFIATALTLTVVGTFFRGPGWSWVWPWR